MSTGRGMNTANVLYIYSEILFSLKENLHYATIWLDLVDIMLSEIIQIQKGKYCIMSLT